MTINVYLSINFVLVVPNANKFQYSKLIPSYMAKHLERLPRNFLWGGLANEFKFHLL